MLIRTSRFVKNRTDGKCRLEAVSVSPERNRLRCGQEKIRHNSRSARPCRLLFRFSLDLHYAVPLGTVFMAFLGEKLFAFLFLNGGRAPPSAPLLLMKDPPGSSHYHLIAGGKRDRSDE